MRIKLVKTSGCESTGKCVNNVPVNENQIG
jgi:hypothetical protein